MFVRIPAPDFGQQKVFRFVLPGDAEADHPMARPATVREFFIRVVHDGVDDCSQAAWEAFYARDIRCFGDL